MLFKEKENLLSLYNGTNEQPKQQILRLSDAFQKKQEFPELELCVTVYNINWGYNKELMDVCHTSREYAQYVKQVRIYAKELPFNEAVEKAVDYCIKNGILEDFLSKNRAEAIEVSIFEYDEEKHMKSEREWAYNNGRKDGLEEGEQRLIKLQQLLLNAGRGEDLTRAINDKDYRQQLYKEYNL
ncbi:MAG: hypothetical protein HDR03_13250 [Lachnospiraceae bacterium]|nr:hypothetical protein [Lachnospiraceae bacterium]